VAAIKTARWFELSARDVVLLPLTDSMDMYRSRLADQARDHGPFDHDAAAGHRARWLDAIATDHLRELGYRDRKALHNLKYFTWVEQQGKTARELDRLWDPDFWTETFAQADEWDRRIAEFNRLAGVAVPAPAAAGRAGAEP
jgi:hypothetical protein